MHFLIRTTIMPMIIQRTGIKKKNKSNSNLTFSGRRHCQFRTQMAVGSGTVFSHGSVLLQEGDWVILHVRYEKKQNFPSFTDNSSPKKRQEEQITDQTPPPARIRISPVSSFLHSGNLRTPPSEYQFAVNS